MQNFNGITLSNLYVAAHIRGAFDISKGLVQLKSVILLTVCVKYAICT